MFQPDQLQAYGVRDVLRETANLINGSGPLESILDAVCARLLQAADAGEVTLALAGPRGCTVRWRRTRSSFTASEDVVDDAVARPCSPTAFRGSISTALRPAARRRASERRGLDDVAARRLR